MAEVFTSISDIFKAGHRRGLQAEDRVRQAYVALFNGNGGQEDADLVLLDLLTVSGYLFVAEPPPGTDAASDAALREMNGARRVGARIAYQLNWPREKLAAVQQAAQNEAVTDESEGIMQ